MAIVTANQLAEKLAELRGHSKVYIDGDFIVLDFSYPYEIHKNRVSTPEEIIGWIYHLLDKNWMTSNGIQAFIQKCSEINKKDYTICG